MLLPQSSKIELAWWFEIAMTGPIVGWFNLHQIGTSTGWAFRVPVGTLSAELPAHLDVHLSPAGDRREKRDRLAGYDRRIQPPLEPDVFFLHEHVEVAAKLTVLVEEARFKVGVELDRRGERFTNGGSPDL